jgi:hypothetical protein
MHRLWTWSVLIGSTWLALAVPAAASIDAVSLVKTELLHCLHPTVKVDTAQVEIDKPTVTEGDTSTTRVRVFYAGVIKQNAMVVEVMEKAGKPPWCAPKSWRIREWVTRQPASICRKGGRR